MSSHRRMAASVTVAIALVCQSELARAQEIPQAPSDAPVQVGPLTLSPTVQLTNFGYDDNVYSTSLNTSQTSDVTATLRPAVGAWLQLAHIRVSGRSDGAFYYFKSHSDLDAVDSNSAARADVLLNRLSPYFVGTLTDT